MKWNEQLALRPGLFINNALLIEDRVTPWEAVPGLLKHRHSDNVCFMYCMCVSLIHSFCLSWSESSFAVTAFHSIKTSALAYCIINDIIPAAFIHLNLERKLRSLFSHKCYYLGNSIIVSGWVKCITVFFFFSLTRWQRTLGAMTKPQAGAYMPFISLAYLFFMCVCVWLMGRYIF